jgi:hypothetical protein
MSLYAKIAQVQAEIGGLKSDKTANVGQYRYDYITDSAIFAQVRHRLAPLGVATFVSVESEEQRDVMSVVHVRVTFVDESGEQFSIRGVGYGTDRADKGCGKAITSAVRYAFTKTFLQGGDEDPEQEYVERVPRVNGHMHVVPEQPVEPPPPGAPIAGEPERIVADQLAAIGADGRKRIKAYLREHDLVVDGDQRSADTWIKSIIAAWSAAPDDDTPMYCDLADVLATIDKVFPPSTPLSRQEDADTRADKEAEGLFENHAPKAQGALTPRMYDANQAGS